MRLDGLLGNERIYMRLQQMQDLPQFLILSGPEGSGKHTLARQMAAAMQCTAETEKPCGHCAACKKVLAGIHPDITEVQSEKRKYIAVDTIREMCADAFIRPNEGKRKVYIIAQPFDPVRFEAQNALLKITEEPPPYGTFLILTGNADGMLSTIRSRAVVLTMAPLSDEQMRKALQSRFADRTEAERIAAGNRSGGWLGQAISLMDAETMLREETARFAECFAAADTIALWKLLHGMEKYKRDAVQQIFLEWQELLTDALAAANGGSTVSDQARAIAASRTGRDILKAQQAVSKHITYLHLNTGIPGLCSMLCILLSE